MDRVSKRVARKAAEKTITALTRLEDLEAFVARVDAAWGQNGSVPGVQFAREVMVARAELDRGGK